MGQALGATLSQGLRSSTESDTASPKFVLVCFSCCNTSAADGVVYKQWTFMSHSVEAGNPRWGISVWWEHSSRLPDVVFSLWPHMVGGTRDLWECSFVRTLIPSWSSSLMTRRPHLLISSHWEFGVNIWIWGYHMHAMAQPCLSESYTLNGARLAGLPLDVGYRTGGFCLWKESPLMSWPKHLKLF